jgi:hypothetical protein
MLKTTHWQWLGALALLLLAAGCPVDINEGMGGGDDGGGGAECESKDLATVRFMHAAGGTPVTRKPGVTSTRNLNVTRPDPEDPDARLTVTSLAAGRASVVQLCGNRPLMLNARLAGASADRMAQPLEITLMPDTDPSKFDVGTTIILASIVFVMLFVSGIEIKPLVVAFTAGGILATLAATLEPYRRRRLLGFLNPWKDSQNTGYQTIQSQVGIARGGITGSGLGQSRAKWGFLPFAHTDFIFAIISEELGLIGALLVVALFVALTADLLVQGITADEPLWSAVRADFPLVLLLRNQQ